MCEYKNIKIVDSMGNISEIQAEIKREFKHGYNLESGAWSLYKINKSDHEAIFIEMRKKGKRKTFIINKNRIISAGDK